MRLGDDALLGCMCLKECGLQQRHVLIGQLAATCQHRARGHLVQLGGLRGHRDAHAQVGDGRDHREHEWIRCHAATRLGVDRRLVVQVGQERVGARRRQARRQEGRLLRVAQRSQLEPVEALEQRLVEASGARGAQQRESLRRQHLGDVRLDARTLLPGLVEAVEEEEGAPRVHRAAQHAVVRRPASEA